MYKILLSYLKLFNMTFGISADEVIDVSNQEQLGIVVRYLRNSQAIEKLLETVTVPKQEMEKPSTSTVHHTNLTYFCLKHPKSCKLRIWLVRCKCWLYFISTHQNVNENWNNLLLQLLLNHLKTKSYHCVKHIWWKGTQHLQI